MAVVHRSKSERDWYIVTRWQEFEGEGRANFLRAMGVTAFYAVELLNYYGLRLGALQMSPVVDRPFHLAVTTVALTWTMVCLGVLLCRKNGFFPAGLKYVSTACDLLLLTIVLGIADGPRSPLVVIYFLIVALACLRFHLPLLWFATCGAVASYLFLLGYVRWGPERSPPLEPLPRYHQIIFVLALVLSGVILGQVIRNVRRLTIAYAERLSPRSGDTHA